MSTTPIFFFSFSFFKKVKWSNVELKLISTSFTYLPYVFFKWRMVSLTDCIAHHLAFCRNSNLWKWFHCDSLTILDVNSFNHSFVIFLSSVYCITKKETNRIIKAVDLRVALQKWIMENTWIYYTRKMNDMLNSAPFSLE